MASITSLVIGSLYTAQAAVQTGVTHFETSDPHLFEEVYKVQEWFQGFNIGAIVLAGFELLKELENLTGFATYLALIDGRVLIGVVLLGIVVVGGIACAVATLINDYFRPTEDLKDSIKNSQHAAHLDVKWDNSAYQTWMQTAHVAGLILSVALIFFSTAPLFYVATAVLELYSIYKTAQWKWIRIDRTFDVPQAGPLADGAQHYTISYLCAVFPSSISNKEDKSCVLCMEDQKDVSFIHDDKHCYCNSCIAGAVGGKSDWFVRSLEETRIHNTETENGIIKREYITYEIKLPRKNFWECPECRHQPRQNEVQVTVRDRFRGAESDISATVELLDPEPEPALPPAELVLQEFEGDGDEEAS